MRYNASRQQAELAGRLDLTRHVGTVCVCEYSAARDRTLSSLIHVMWTRGSRSPLRARCLSAFVVLSTNTRGEREVAVVCSVYGFTQYGNHRFIWCVLLRNTTVKRLGRGTPASRQSGEFYAYFTALFVFLNVDLAVALAGTFQTCATNTSESVWCSRSLAGRS